MVLGPETRYPLRARVVRGWDYELVDASTNYDFVVHRDGFGMLAHQRDTERVTRYHRPSFFSFTPDGVFRIYLGDWAPHPNAECAARGSGTPALVDFVDTGVSGAGHADLDFIAAGHVLLLALAHTDQLRAVGQFSQVFAAKIAGDEGAHQRANSASSLAAQMKSLRVRPPASWVE